MTPQQAATLQPGDPVTITHSPTSAGTVLRLIGAGLLIRWRGGRDLYYSLGSMPHIERAPVAPHDT